MTDTSAFFDMTAAPMRIGTVRLKVRDLDTVADFYRRVLGLGTIEAQGNRVVLGTGATPLLELEGDPTLAPRDPRQAGLFHTAFLMPTRADSPAGSPMPPPRACRCRARPITSSARRSIWPTPKATGSRSMPTGPARRGRAATATVQHGDRSAGPERPGLCRPRRPPGPACPRAACVGHVHLQVGDSAAGRGLLPRHPGLRVTARYPGAGFYGSGGYHHHIATNVWNSRARARARPDRSRRPG